MSGSVGRKRMWVADVVLRRAAQILPLQLSSAALPTDLDEINVPAARAMNLANLDLLESAGRAGDLRGGFWRDLMRACDMLGLDDRMPVLVAEYRAALQRVGASTSPSPDPDMASVAARDQRLHAGRYTAHSGCPACRTPYRA